MSGPVQRRQELLALRATDGLEPSARIELAALLRDVPPGAAGALDRAAAAIELAYSRPEPMPASLRGRIAGRLHVAMASRPGSSANVVPFPGRFRD